MKKLLNQIIRFGLVGGSAFIIDFAVLWLLTDIVGLNYLVSNGISFTASVIYNYILSTVWVFEVKQEKNKVIELIVFIILSAIGLGLNQLLMWLAVDKMAINYMISKVVATGIVMVYNFITRKIFLEKV